MVVGVIGAMEEEVSLIRDLMTEVSASSVAGLDLWCGSLDGHRIVLVRCGIGKVNAALATQVLIDRFDVSCVVNTGVAGSLDATLDIGDIVVSVDAVVHDFMCFGSPQVPGIDVLAFPASPQMRAAALTAASSIGQGVSVREGRVVSGDQFVSDEATKRRLVETFDGTCCEMEGAAIAQVCYLNDVPFCLIRAISDKADGSAPDSFADFVGTSAHRSAALVRNMIGHLPQ